MCAHCHENRYVTYEKTAHHLTSQVADKNTILGDFTPGANVMATANPLLTFRMEEKGDEFFQTAIWAAAEGGAARTHTERFDLVIGSGEKDRPTYMGETASCFNSR